MTGWTSCSGVERHSERVNGCCGSTSARVPVPTLFENLEDGASIDQFREWFSRIEGWQVVSVLEHESEALRETDYPRRYCSIGAHPHTCAST